MAVRSERNTLAFLALCAVVLLAFALRVARLGAQDLWGDEAASATLSLAPLSTMLRDLAQGEPHPPLYPLLLWLWAKLAGHGEFALRFPSLLFGVAMVPLAAATGRRLQGRALAALAALIVSLNPFLIWYSQETRMYIVVAAFALWAATALMRGLAGGRLAWLEFAASAAAMIYAHYYGLLVLGAYLLLIAAGLLRRRLPLRPWLSALALIGVLYLPWVVYASRIFFSYYGVAPGRVDLWAVFASFWPRAALGWAIEQQDALRWLPLFLVLAALGIVAATRARAEMGHRIDPRHSPIHRHSEPKRSGGEESVAPSVKYQLERSAAGLPNRHATPSAPVWRAILLLSWLLVPLGGGFLVSFVRPMYAERYLIVSAIPLLILVAWGLVLLLRWWPLHAAALALVLAATFFPLRSQYLDQRYVKSEYSRHTTEVAGLARPGDGIILDGSSQTPLFDYYYRGALPHYPVPRALPLDEAATAAELRALSERHSGLWVFFYATHDYDPGDFVERWLSDNAFRAWHTWTVNGRLVYYASYRPDDLTTQPVGARFGEALALAGFATRQQPYAAGEVVPLLLHWRAIAAPARDLKLSLRLRDADGFLWGQTDVEPVSGFRPTRTWAQGDEVDDRVGLLILPGTPPGRYNVELRVYPPGGSALPVSREGAATSDVLSLGEVVVGQAWQQVTGIGIPDFRPLGVAFGDQLVLEGASGAGEITAGQSGYLTLLWRALRQPGADYTARLRLVDAQGKVGAEVLARAPNGSYSPTQWSAGDVLRWQYNLRLPAKTPPGEYRLLLSLLSPSGEALPASGSVDAVELRRVLVKPRPKIVPSARPQVELRAVLGDKIALRGYSLGPEPPVPGGKLGLTLHWEPLAEVDLPYTVFIHLLDAHEQIWGQRDAQPCAGDCPTTSWLPGDLIEDRYELAIKPEAPPGEYAIAFGMYDAATGRRLVISDPTGRPAGDRVLLPKILLGDR